MIPELAAEGPTTVGMLRGPHLALMREWRTMDSDDAKAEHAAALRERVKRAGRDIADPGERDEAQGILDYWTSAIAALSERAYPPFAELDGYVGEAGMRASGDARQTYMALETEEDRRIAKAVFEDLMVKGPEGFERSGERSRAVLQQRIRGTRLDPVLAAFQASGAIARSPGDKPEDDRFEVTAANLAEQWPELAEWLSDRDDYDRMRDYLLRRAEQWKASGRSRTYLASGKDIKAIDRFNGETDTLDEFIVASKRGRWRLLIVGALLLLGVLAFVGFAGNRFWSLSEFKQTADTKIADAETKANQAVEDATVAQVVVSDPTVAASSGAAVGTSSATRLGLPSLEGAVWLGSDERPQVAAPVWRSALVKPSAAQDGTAYRVLADINLREAMPTAGGAYSTQRQTAVIRAGTLLIVKGQTRSYGRPTGVQYWAQVQIVPRVYIQYVNQPRGAVETLRTQLADAGFDVPAAEQIDTARGLSEIRYFNLKDREVANALLTVMNAAGSNPQAAVRCRSFAGSRASNRFSLELWTDGAVRRPVPGGPCP